MHALSEWRHITAQPSQTMEEFSSIVSYADVLLARHVTLPNKMTNSLSFHADLSVYFRNGHNRWILYPEGSIYYSGLSLRECSF